MKWQVTVVRQKNDPLFRTVIFLLQPYTKVQVSETPHIKSGQTPRT
jgi:hypothetical protein